MEFNLKEELNKINITVGYFQLKDVDLPDDYENTVEEKEIQLQQIPKAQFEQDKLIVEAETSLKVAKETAEIVRIQAQAEAQSIRLTVAADANRTLTEVKAYEEALESLRTGLGFEDYHILTYMWIDMFKNLPAEKCIINLEKPNELLM